MHKAMATAALAAALLMLAGCGGDSAPGSPTAEENEQLNEASEMLDTSPDDLRVGEEAELGNGEEEVVEDEAADNGAAGNEAVNAQ